MSDPADLSTEMIALDAAASAAGLSTFQMVGHTGRRRSIIWTAGENGFELDNNAHPIRFSSADSVVTIAAGKKTLGPNLVTNGDFEASWTPGAVPGWDKFAGVADLTVVSGRLHVQALETATNQGAFQLGIATTIGQNYQFRASGQGSIGYRVELLSADSTPLYDSGFTTGSQEFGPATVTAIETSMVVRLSLNNVPLDEFAEFDDIRLQLAT